MPQNDGHAAQRFPSYGDIARRLKSLDLEQQQVAEALGRRVDAADEYALRRSRAA